MLPAYIKHNALLASYGGLLCMCNVHCACHGALLSCVLGRFTVATQMYIYMQFNNMIQRECSIYALFCTIQPICWFECEARFIRHVDQ